MVEFSIANIPFHPGIIVNQKIVETCFQLTAAQSISKNIRLINNVSSKTLAFADKNMLETVLRNLITNALKFTPGEGEVTISTEEFGTFHKINVSDTGIGLSEEDKKLLFRTNVNVSKIGRSSEKGTGLGLLLCKEFIEYHDGKIWVESNYPQGSIFCFTVPKFLEKNS